MNKAVGIRFKSAGKIYDFDCGAFVLKPGDPVIVETDQGLGFGTVAVMPTTYDETKLKRPLKKIFRLATDKDFAQLESNRNKEKEAHIYCQECIRKLKLDMNLFSVESTFDGGKMTYFFTAEARVDFRELVKMIAKKLNVRVEMRQVGIRNQAKMCGGLGRCGRELCCATFIDKFDPVSIRMAKDQGLSLNPTKISGQCGRLMCCLTYEHKTYSEMKKQFPKIGKTVNTAAGRGKVLRHNIMAGSLVIRLDDNEEKEISLEEILKDRGPSDIQADQGRGMEKEGAKGDPPDSDEEDESPENGEQKYDGVDSQNSEDSGTTDEGGRKTDGSEDGENQRPRRGGGKGRRSQGRRGGQRHHTRRGKPEKRDEKSNSGNSDNGR